MNSLSDKLTVEDLDFSLLQTDNGNTFFSIISPVQLGVAKMVLVMLFPTISNLCEKYSIGKQTNQILK